MKTFLRNILIVMGVFVAFLLVIPFLIPVPPIENTVNNPELLAEEQSKFIEINGIKVHYIEYGSGPETIILLHGFGASTFSWREVMEPLGKEYRVIAYDWIGFGLTERPVQGEWTETNPYSTIGQSDILLGLMDNLGIEKAILAGNSAGGKISAYTAYKYPDRITKLILIDPAIRAGRRQPAWINALFESHQMDRIGPLISRLILIRGEDLLRVAWNDPSLITQEIIDGYKKPLRMANWDKALWEFTKAAQVDIEHLLIEIMQPVLILTGDNDRIVPTQQTVELSSLFTNGRLVIIESSGHVPQEEQPDEFVYQIMSFLQEE